MYLATIKKIAYLCNEDKHTICYSKVCKTHECNVTHETFKQSIGNSEKEVLENIRVYLIGIFGPCKVSDFSISIRINEIPETGVFWAGLGGYNIAKIFEND